MIALINFTYRIVLCFQRHFSGNRNPDKFAAPIAGFISGLWLGFDNYKGRR